MQISKAISCQATSPTPPKHHLNDVVANLISLGVLQLAQWKSHVENPYPLPKFNMEPENDGFQ